MKDTNQLQAEIKRVLNFFFTLVKEVKVEDDYFESDPNAIRRIKRHGESVSFQDVEFKLEGGLVSSRSGGATCSPIVLLCLLPPDNTTQPAGTRSPAFRLRLSLPHEGTEFAVSALVEKFELADPTAGLRTKVLYSVVDQWVRFFKKE